MCLRIGRIRSKVDILRTDFLIILNYWRISSTMEILKHNMWTLDLLLLGPSNRGIKFHFMLYHSWWNILWSWALCKLFGIHFHLLDNRSLVLFLRLILIIRLLSQFKLSLDFTNVFMGIALSRMVPVDHQHGFFILLFELLHGLGVDGRE